MSSQDALDIDQTGLLSVSTLSALQISQQPFAPGQGESEAENALFSDEVTAEQLADIKQALITGDDLLLVLGEEGAGKSTLLSQLGANSGLRIQCFAVKGSARFSTMNLFAGMLEAFKRTPPETLKQILDELIPCLQTMVSRNTLSAIVLDDAHMVSEAELTQLLSGMLYVNSQDETLMRVALAAPSDFEDKIPDLLPEGADLPYSSLTIDGLTPSRAAAYVGFRLAQAGYIDESPFTERAITDLTDQSEGLPAVLHTLVADDLNKRHGPIEDSLPAELISEPSNSFLHSRMGKMVLGALATLFILIGLVLFMKPANDDNSDRYSAANQNQIEIEESAKKLKLLKEEPTDETALATNTNTDVSDSASTGVDADSTSPGTLSSANPIIDDIAPTVVESPVQEPIPEPEPEPLEEPAPVVVVVAEPTEVPTISVDADQESATQEPSADSQQSAVAEANTDSTNDSTDDSTLDSATAGGAGFLESPNWILVQDSSQFTVQMSASTDRPSVEEFLKRNPLNPPNSIFSFDRSGVTWYALVHGLFATIEEARQAVERLPASAQSNQPWIRSVERVQDVLKEQ